MSLAIHIPRARYVLLLTSVSLAYAGMENPSGVPLLGRNGSIVQMNTSDPASVLVSMKGESTRRHIVVQFDRTLNPQQKSLLGDAGLTILDPLGVGAYTASLEPSRLDIHTVGQAVILKGIATLEPNMKLHPALNRSATFEWMSPGNENDDEGNPRVVVHVAFFSDVDASREGPAIIARHGGRIRHTFQSLPAMSVDLPRDRLDLLATEDSVLSIEPPIVLGSLNDSNRELTGANMAHSTPYGLNGEGVVVLVYDAGHAESAHPDFGGRILQTDDSPLSDHATHVTGTIGGDGTLSDGAYAGMAPAVNIVSFGLQFPDGSLDGWPFFDDPFDLENNYQEAIVTHGAHIANNSIGMNICTNGFPCELTGDYGITGALVDGIIRGQLGAPLRIVWAAGNERNPYCTRCRDEGVHTPEGYHSVPPPATAKNPIAVGAVNSNDDSITVFTSWGPTDDGRLKPDVVAPGCQSDGDNGVTSTVSGGTYDTYCGTSMAAPTVTGLLSLLLQDYRAQHPESTELKNATLKALLVHNAVDIASPGPDYQSGYGSVRIIPTLEFARSGRFAEDALQHRQSHWRMVHVPSDTSLLKMTLAWDDVPAVPAVQRTLVNDLDLRVYDPQGNRHFPWTLTPTQPFANAVRDREDHVNNLEQVLVASPMPGNWYVEVFGHDIPQGVQSYSLCMTPTLTTDCDNNGIDDDQEILIQPSLDCTSNGMLDVCEPDCNNNGAADTCDIHFGFSEDCSGNSIPDECEEDCNLNQLADSCEVFFGTGMDCNHNGVLDVCETDCDADGVADECAIADGTRQDCNGNAIPDNCESDCNHTGVADECEIAQNFSSDCNVNGVPDECDIREGASQDCDSNFIPDECDRAHPQFIRLSTLNGTSGFRIHEGLFADALGSGVSRLGDINRDGIDDFLVGAASSPVHGSAFSGRAYVVFGSPDLGSHGTLDPGTLDGDNGFIVPATEDYAGMGLAALSADFNGDGRADIAIAAPWSPGSTPSDSEVGKVYIVFGDDSLKHTGGLLDVSLLDGSNGFVVLGKQPLDFAGQSLASGDFNNDGIADLVIGATIEDVGVGECYVLFGHADIGSSGQIALSDLNGVNGFVIHGFQFNGDFTPIQVDSGDFNGDGIADVLLGVDNADYRHDLIPHGRAYVLFGAAFLGGDGIFEIDMLNGSNGFQFIGAQPWDRTGASVANVGDLNHDGLDDLIIGAPGASSHGLAGSGESYVVFGDEQLGAGGALSALDLNGHNGFTIHGAHYTDSSGTHVGSAGDFNGDSIDDAVIGAIFAAPYGISGAGEVYVLYGSDSIGLTGSVELSYMMPLEGVVLRGDVVWDNAGYSASPAGDVNADGTADLIIGAPHLRFPSSSAQFPGSAYVVFGQEARQDCNANQVPDACETDGDCNDNRVPDQCEGSGDLNGDCRLDIADVSGFQSCWSTSTDPYPLGLDCIYLDMDGDLDVDADDQEYFETLSAESVACESSWSTTCSENLVRLSAITAHPGHAVNIRVSRHPSFVNYIPGGVDEKGTEIVYPDRYHNGTHIEQLWVTFLAEPNIPDPVHSLPELTHPSSVDIAPYWKHNHRVHRGTHITINVAEEGPHVLTFFETAGRLGVATVKEESR